MWGVARLLFIYTHSYMHIHESLRTTSLMSTSHHPVKSSKRLKSLWPCRTNTTACACPGKVAILPPFSARLMRLLPPVLSPADALMGVRRVVLVVVVVVGAVGAWRRRNRGLEAEYDRWWGALPTAPHNDDDDGGSTNAAVCAAVAAASVRRREVVVPAARSLIRPLAGRSWCRPMLLGLGLLVYRRARARVVGGC